MALVAGVSIAQQAPAVSLDTRLPRSTKTPAATSPLTGLSLRVLTGGSDGYGYRPVRFRFSAPAPAASDRLLTVKFYEGRYSQNRSQLTARATVERDGEMPAAAGGASVSLAVPSFDTWSLVWWDVWVDGVRDPSLSVAPGQAIAHPISSNPLSTLAPRRLAGAERVLAECAPPRSVLFPGEQLTDPPRWIDYTQHDFVLASVRSLEEAEQEAPQRVASLRRWIELGGTLLVGGVQPNDYAELDRLLATDRRFAWTPEEGDEQGPADGWRWARLAKPRDSAAPVPSVDEVLESQGDRYQEEPRRRAGFSERRYGFGVVAAFPPEWRPGAGSGSQPRSKAVDEFRDHWRRRSWVQRHGLAPDEANDDFANLLVPGVGLAPVIEFQVLITLFVVLVGPVNYWLLKRSQRAHLMVLTVPISAAALTASLLLYALLADGFGASVRVRAVTLIDQPRGEQASWGRLSYYSGLAPGEGLTLPGDCLLYPILPGWNELHMAPTAAPTRGVEWVADQPAEQRLRGGWLRSRAPTQYLQLRTSKTDRRLEVRFDDAAARVENALGADVELLLVTDHDGGLHTAERVRDGRQAELVAIDPIDAATKIRASVVENEPLPPVGLDGGNQGSLIDLERRAIQRRLQRDLQLEYSSSRASDSLLNLMIDELSGFTGGGVLRLPPRSYVAVTRTTVGVALGLDRVGESGGYHVVLGRW